MYICTPPFECQNEYQDQNIVESPNSAFLTVNKCDALVGVYCNSSEQMLSDISDSILAQVAKFNDEI